MINFILFLQDINLQNDEARTGNICYKYVKRTLSYNSSTADHKDPYTLLIAVLLSAMHRCACKPDYAFTFAKADNPYDMVKNEEIKEIIRPCGLSPMKSKGIHGLSHTRQTRWKSTSEF
jgi:endonuclease III